MQETTHFVFMPCVGKKIGGGILRFAVFAIFCDFRILFGGGVIANLNHENI